MSSHLEGYVEKKHAASHRIRFKTQSLEPVHCLYGLANVTASYLIAALKMLAVSMLLGK